MRLAEFAGLWRITREIRDLAGGPDGRMEGEARFTPDGAGLTYDETGRLRLGEGPGFTACRRYLWRETAAGIELRFADGGFFHAFRPEAPAAEHLCGADLYRVRYDFTRWPDWRAEWRVKGPRKDYRMSTRYDRPLPASDASQQLERRPGPSGGSPP